MAENVKDPKALFRIGYGLYLVTARQGEQDNGMIANAVMQVTNTPEKVAIALNKSSLTHDMILATGVLNISCLSVDTPYAFFEHFGMKSGKTVSKFDEKAVTRTENGLAYEASVANAVISLAVEQATDLGTHTLFLCAVTGSRVLSDRPTMTYDEYHARVKPKPAAPKKKGYVCRICGYVYEGETLPADFVCPLCAHGAADFESIEA